MSKYIITGKDLKRGDLTSDSSDLNEYFELGWELTSTFLEAYWRRKTNRLQASDVIVTATGREFLYRSLFERVIDYTTFLSSPEREQVEIEDFVTATLTRYQDVMTRRLPRLRIMGRHSFRYRYLYRPCFDKSDITTGNPGLNIPTEPFLCLCIRVRQHSPTRNLPDSYWLEFLDALAEKTCFIVGTGIDHLVRHPRHRVCTLAEFSALAGSPHCEAVVGTMTGPMQLAQLVHPRKLIVIDIDKHYPFMNRVYPCVLSDCSNFANVRHSLYMYLPSIPEILEDLAGRTGESRINPAHLDNPRYRRMIRLDQRRGHRFFEIPKT